MPILNDHDFFKVDTIQPSIQKKEGGFDLPSWTPITYLQEIANQIHKQEIHDSETINLFLEITRPLTKNKNIWISPFIFENMFLVPIEYLTPDDVKKSFQMINRIVKKSLHVEVSTRRGYFNILPNIKNSKHDRSVFKNFLRKLMKLDYANDNNLRGAELFYFRDFDFSSFQDDFLDFETKYKNKPFILEDILSVFSKVLTSLVTKNNANEKNIDWSSPVADCEDSFYTGSNFATLRYSMFKIADFLIKIIQRFALLICAKNQRKPNCFKSISPLLEKTQIF